MVAFKYLEVTVTFLFPPFARKRLDVPAELSQMKTRDAWILRVSILGGRPEVFSIISSVINYWL